MNHPRPLAGFTVLVGDDHYDTVQMLVEYLLSAGAIVLGLRSARAAMGFAKTVRFDAVLINLRMPGEDGRWFVRELRASKTLSAQTPVFALSSERQDEPDRDDGFAGYFRIAKVLKVKLSDLLN